MYDMKDVMREHLYNMSMKDKNFIEYITVKYDKIIINNIESLFTPYLFIEYIIVEIFNEYIHYWKMMDMIQLILEDLQEKQMFNNFSYLSLYYIVERYLEKYV